MEKGLPNLISTYTPNWPDKPIKIVGLVLLLTLFFSSCQEPIETPSRNLVPDDNNTDLRYIEIPLEVTQAAFDTSIVSSNNLGPNVSRGVIYTGYNNNEEIGIAELDAYTGLLLEAGFQRDSITVLSEVLSARLVLRFNYLYGTDFEFPQSFEVHRLSQNITANKRYKIYESLAIGDLVSAANSVVVDPERLLNSNTTDSLVIPLTEAFGRIIRNAVANDTLSATELSDQLRGIKISSITENNTIQGINIASGQSYIELAFKEAGKSNDTLKLNFTTSSFTGVDFMPQGILPTNYSADRSFSLTTPDKVYFNGLLGIFPKVRIDNYLSFIDSLQFMIVDKAELVIDPRQEVIDNGSDQLRPPSLVFPYYLADDKILKKAEDFWGIQSNFTQSGRFADQNTAQNLLVISYKTNSQEISGDVSFFLQEIFDNRDFWPQNRSILLNGQFISRNAQPFDDRATFSIGDYNNFLIASNDIKLRIYYTVFDN